jgi:hypothetical protein
MHALDEPILKHRNTSSVIGWALSRQFSSPDAFRSMARFYLLCQGGKPRYIDQTETETA